MSNEDLEIYKNKNKRSSLSPYQNYNDKVLQHYSKEEFLALQNLHKNTNAVQKSDKDQSLVIADKADYLDKMENLLNDTLTFEKLHLKNDGVLNTAVNQEKRAENIFRKLVASNSISEETRRYLKPVGTRSGIMYRFVKFPKISSIIACLFDLFCQKFILLTIN